MALKGTFLIVSSDTRAAVVQRVLHWAQEDRGLIQYHVGYPVSYVRIPPEAATGDHGDLVLADGGTPVELGVDRMVWVEPTVFEVDGIHPDHGIEYDLIVEGFGAQSTPSTDTIVIAWDYSGTAQERTEPDGWVLRYRELAAEGQPEKEWLKRELRGYERVVRVRRLKPGTSYEFSIQGAVGHGAGRVLTPATVPITISTASEAGEEPPPAPPPQSPPPPSPSGAATPPQARPQTAARRAEPRRASGPEKKTTGTT